MRRGRWSLGVVVAIVVAIAAATAGQHPHRASTTRAEAPLQVTLALESDGVELRVASEGFALAFRI